MYVEALEARIVGRTLETVPRRERIPPRRRCAVFGRRVDSVCRVGKRVVALEADLYLALHLMIAGRRHWRSEERRFRGKWL